MAAVEIASLLARKAERLYLKVYRCPAGIPTIGYGHVVPSMDTPEITPDIAEALLKLDMTKALNQALALCPVLLLESENRKAAIADFVFNLGSGRLKISTLRKAINARDWNKAATELTYWVHGGGRRLRGLVLRRAAEIVLIKRG